jgi:hypothetical protein
MKMVQCCCSFTCKCWTVQVQLPMQVQDSCHCVWWAVASGANENGAMLLQLHMQVLDSAGAAAHAGASLQVLDSAGAASHAGAGECRCRTDAIVNCCSCCQIKCWTVQVQLHMQVLESAGAGQMPLWTVAAAAKSSAGQCRCSFTCRIDAIVSGGLL